MKVGLFNLVQKNIFRKAVAVVCVALSILSMKAAAFELSSTEISEGGTLPLQSVFEGFGCHGGNHSPALNWSSAPANTQSFAVTAYDPDAPTGSGWWHWVVYDIPATVHSLEAGMGTASMLPSLGKQGRNDFGSYAFGGACPPVGDKPHHYIFTVYALKSASLNVPADASPALIGFMIHGATLAKATLTVRYSR